MKQGYILPILLILFCTTLENPKETEAKVVFQENLEKVEKFEENKVEERFKEGDYIFIQYTASWCGPCQLLKQKVKTPAFQEWLKNNTKGYYFVDMDSNDSNTVGWKKKLNVTSYPTIAVFERKDNKWKLYRYIKGNQDLNLLKAMIR